MIKAGDFIKHRDYKDVMILVMSKPRTSNGVTHVDGIWHCMCNCHASSNIGLVARLSIKAEDLPNWQVCEEPKRPNKKEASWCQITKTEGLASAEACPS